ncbi:MAG TPA: cupin domain-containing protein [Limnochordia bacterium]
MPTIDVAAAMEGQSSLWQILHTTDRSQIAVMVLAPGEASSAAMNVHPGEDQLLFVTEGRLDAEIGAERTVVRAGQLALVPAGTPHRFVNRGDAPARTLNIYTPPAY